uniref:Uncharacterized protein n=1 Tax=Cuerna arida TaxID=1464854 RepID=A0A1B6GZ19_9HEMI
MLSPEIWNFKPPKHNHVVLKGSSETCGKFKKIIDDHYFNHSVTVILPDTVLVPEELNTVLTKDSEYYKVDQLPVHRFLDKKFIDFFVKSGRLFALSVGTQLDTDDCAAVTPCGHLILNLRKETYNTLGLQGEQSRFSTERYVVKIDLKNPSFTPGKKNYEWVVKCLSHHLDLQMDFLVSWEPPDATAEGLVCPSSVAAHLSKLGYNISGCSPQEWSSRRYGVKLPDWNSLEHDELLEWLGAVAVGVDMSREDAEGLYLSSYRGSNEAKGECQVAVLNYSGFFTPTRICRLYNVFSEYVKKRKDLPYAAMHVQGFSDSPVSWLLQEHVYRADGHNQYTLVLRSDLSYLLFTTVVSPKKIKIKIS